MADKPSKTSGNGKNPPPPPLQDKSRKSDRLLKLNGSAVGADLAILNATDLFFGRLTFEALCRRGPMILANTDKGQIIFPTIREVLSFLRARVVIADDTNVFLPCPSRNQITRIWEPIADLIVRIAAKDSVRTEHHLKAECRDLITLMWRYARQPLAETPDDFVRFIVEISQTVVRNADKPAPPCVFVAEGFAWVHVPTFRNWLSLPTVTNRLYPFGDICQGLLMLGFEKQNTCRRTEGSKVTLRLWRGPLDALTDGA